MRQQRILQLYQRFALDRLQAAVACDAAAVVKHLHRVLCNIDVYFLTNQVVRHRASVPAVEYQVIVGNLGYGPHSCFKSHGRQWQHVRLFFLQLGAAVRTCHPLVIQLLQPLRYGLVHFTASSLSSYPRRLPRRCSSCTVAPPRTCTLGCALRLPGHTPEGYRPPNLLGWHLLACSGCEW